MYEEERGKQLMGKWRPREREKVTSLKWQMNPRERESGDLQWTCSRMQKGNERANSGGEREREREGFKWVSFIPLPPSSRGNDWELFHRLLQNGAYKTALPSGRPEGREKALGVTNMRN